MSNRYKIDKILSDCLICTEYLYFLCKKYCGKDWEDFNYDKRLKYTIDFLEDHPEYLFCIHIKSKE